MNLPKYPDSEHALPAIDNIQSLISDAASYERDEFNKEATKLTGKWYKDADGFAQENNSLEYQVFLKLWQSNDDSIARRVLLSTGDLEIIPNQEKPMRVITTTFSDLGMTAFNNEVGLVFITDGDISDDLNEGLFIPMNQRKLVRVSSHLLVSNK